MNQPSLPQCLQLSLVQSNPLLIPIKQIVEVLVQQVAIYVYVVHLLAYYYLLRVGR